MRDGGSPWMLRVEGTSSAFGAVLKADGDLDVLRVQVAALEFATRHGVPAPELIAYDLEGSAAEVPLLLLGVIEGSSTIPVEASTQRLRSMGAAGAAVNRITVTPSTELPFRDRPIALDDYPAQRLRTGLSTPLLQEADQAFEQRRPNGPATVFVHGDLWQGNMMWQGDRCVGLVDWDCAGAGHYGVDLGSLRLDAALMFGEPAADVVLRGWEEAAGFPAADVAYADLAAAVNQPTEMAGFTSAIQGQGRSDLIADVLNERRNRFLAIGRAHV